VELKSKCPGHLAWPDYPDRTEEGLMGEFGDLVIYLRQVRKLSVHDTVAVLELLQQTIEEDMEWNRTQIH
jgi:hypothetical protein